MNVYDPSKCAVFHLTRKQWGELSNFANFPVHLGMWKFPTSEHLYQAAKFPHLPDVQQQVYSATTPSESKVIAYTYKDHVRSDWHQNVKVAVMVWVLALKYRQHDQIQETLRKTGLMPIVEKSTRDSYWGAVPQPDGMLHGGNVLGTCWMRLREKTRFKDIGIILPPRVPNFRIFGETVGSL